jgi:hypothetical protein
MIKGEAQASMTDRELLVMCFERILSDWRQIDSEWGAIGDGGLEGAIERGEETLIPLLRKQLGGEK